MHLKLENQRQATVHAVDVQGDNETPPDALIWEGGVYRYVRTDGLFDQKKHVYREASIMALGTPLEEADREVESIAHASIEAQTRAQAAGALKIAMSLNAKQADLLQRLRIEGGYPNNKAVLVAGLEGLKQGGGLTNEALLAVLSRRLRGARVDAA